VQEWSKGHHIYLLMAFFVSELRRSFFFTAEAQRELPSFKAATVIILSHLLCASAVKNPTDKWQKLHVFFLSVSSFRKKSSTSRSYNF